MSLMYELLDVYAESYETEKSEAEFEMLHQAVERLNQAYEEDSLEARLKGLREAAAMSRKLDDEPLTLVFDFYLGNELIGTLNDMIEGVAVVRPAAMASRTESYAQRPQRIGLNNMLASAYTLIDPLGYADEIQTIGQLVEESPLTDNEDLCIGLGATYEVQLARGDIQAATETRDEIWAHTRALDDPLYYLHAATYDTELAFQRGDWQGMIDAAAACWEMVEQADGSNGIDGHLSGAVDDASDDSIGHDDVELTGESAPSAFDRESEFGDSMSDNANWDGDGYRDSYGDEEEEDFDADGEDDIETDTDYMVVAAAQSCGLAKLGRGDEILGAETSNPDPDQPAPYNFYLYWVECLIALDRSDEAVTMAEEGWEEMLGKGQHYRETQMLCLIVRALHAAGRPGEVDSWIRKAREVASLLLDPGPMNHQIEEAQSGEG